ncbi:MAG: sugar ABC transporter ATP-binding protein [Spirochaetales bacterium]|nr:sugar ABC transporter ATP-binding protein [Spirochaetales bacterium]
MALNTEYEFAVKIEKCCKYYGHIHALKEIDFEVGSNEVVGLIGDNGAGKSSLIKIITGVYPPTSGNFYIKGKKIDPRSFSVKQAQNMGIATVYQDRSLAEKQDLWRNFFIGRQITNAFGFINVKKEKAIAKEILLNTIGFRGVGITVDSKVSTLSGGERQGIAIGRAMYFDSDLIILDEPTVALSLKEIKKVINFVEKIKENNKASIFISHNIADVYSVSDRFVVLDRGEVVGNIPKSDISLKDLNTFLLDYAHRLKDEDK